MREGPRGAFSHPSVMHFYSGPPMHFLSGVDIAPKVRSHARYEVHYGLMKSLDLGKTLKRPKLA